MNFEDDIKRIFDRQEFHCMDRVRIEVNDDGDREKLNLRNYDSICKMSRFVDRTIKGYGYKRSGDYDALKKSDPETFEEFKRFIHVACRQRPEDRDSVLLEKFANYIDPANFWPRAMPHPGGPLSHKEVTQFEDWLAEGMPKSSDPNSKYQGEIVPLWPEPF